MYDLYAHVHSLREYEYRDFIPTLRNMRNVILKIDVDVKDAFFFNHPNLTLVLTYGNPYIDYVNSKSTVRV